MPLVCREPSRFGARVRESTACSRGGRVASAHGQVTGPKFRSSIAMSAVVITESPSKSPNAELRGSK